MHVRRRARCQVGCSAVQDPTFVCQDDGEAHLTFPPEWQRWAPATVIPVLCALVTEDGPVHNRAAVALLNDPGSSCGAQPCCMCALVLSLQTEFGCAASAVMASCVTFCFAPGKLRIWAEACAASVPVARAGLVAPKGCIHVEVDGDCVPDELQSIFHDGRSSAAVAFKSCVFPACKHASCGLVFTTKDASRQSHVESCNAAQQAETDAAVTEPSAVRLDMSAETVRVSAPAPGAHIPGMLLLPDRACRTGVRTSYESPHLLPSQRERGFAGVADA